MSSGYRSIGEVLSLLSAEHPDLTISKIRFLESQGLISPQRTPSGYRKFFEADIEQLDWVLAQQRDHFLPLKEIKRRLASGAVTSRVARAAESLAVSAPPTPSLFARRQEAGDGAETAAASDAGAPIADSPALDADAVDSQAAHAPAAFAPSVSMSQAEIAAAVGVDAEFVADLQRLGIIAPASDAGDQAEPVYDHEAMLTARTAAAFAARGVPTRNLRMFRVAADREAGVYDQLMAALRARGDTPRLRTELTEVVDLAETLRRQLLRRLLRPYLD